MVTNNIILLYPAIKPMHKVDYMHIAWFRGGSREGECNYKPETVDFRSCIIYYKCIWTPICLEGSDVVIESPHPRLEVVLLATGCYDVRNRNSIVPIIKHHQCVQRELYPPLIALMGCVAKGPTT